MLRRRTKQKVFATTVVLILVFVAFLAFALAANKSDYYKCRWWQEWLGWCKRS